MKETFSNNLKQYRKQKQLSQEQLAEQLGITTQAVSKWECSLSYPDIDLLPRLADLFGVSIDTLLRGDASCTGTDGGTTDHTDGAGQTGKAANGPAADDTVPFPQPDLPDDNVLRIVQYRGKTLLRKDTYDPNIRIPLSLTCEPRTKKFFHNKVSVSGWDSDAPLTPIEIWGSADIFGDLCGSAKIGASVTCSGDINGTVNAGMSVECSGDISGPANAGQNITCHGDINGDTKSGGDITCDGDINGIASADRNLSCDGDINGDASAQGGVTCGGDINGNASAQGSITCGGDINSDVSANGSVNCDGDISGDISAKGNVSCDGDISGDVSAGGNIICDGDIS